MRGLLRSAGTGAVAAVIAIGVLFTASASIPAAHPSGQGGELPIRFYGLLQSLTVGDTSTAPDGVTLGQVVAVLERAEQEAQEQGPNFSPTIAQAAAELGMLYTTYQMQQLAFGENNEGLRIEDAPVARGSEPDADAPESGTGTDGADDTDTDTDTDTDADDGDTEEPQPEEEAPPVVQVSNGSTSVIDPHVDDPQAGYITYEEVVIAAVRLANMLDPSVPNALVEVQGLDAPGGFSLRESLLDVVSAFGGSTAGYANGRIPADVLCQLEFASGHMLRCDAAERLTALSALFEEEFGYPIPITDSYRSYEAQVAVASAKPHLAAIPGTSNHGWGLAVDLDNPIAGGNSPEYVWLRLHGPDYGWDNPSWAQLGGAKPEPWHFEFFAAGSIPNRAIDPSDVGTWTPTDSATPRYKPAFDPKPSDGGSADEPDRPDGPDEGSDGPGSNPPSQKPPVPSDGPTPSEPEPTPTRTTRPTIPAPSPSPSEPSPSPSCPPPDDTDPEPGASPAPEPSPSPSPSCPGEEPGDGSGETGTPDPVPSSSASSAPLATLPKGTGVVTDDTEEP
ncbi:M15 family metallopeptidase [Promicromonospora sp. Populi]|uniref:M15 family metallopeptidase n=1 Tax=Promicromonospora sp. Populi TaxID=3239420 RepID=UPI0034E2BACE